MDVTLKKLVVGIIVAMSASLLAPRAEAQSFSSPAQAQNYLERALEDARMPVTVGNRSVPGVVVSLEVSAPDPNNCETRVVASRPAYTFDGVSVPAASHTSVLKWSEPTSATVNLMFVIVRGPGLPPDGQIFYLPSSEDAESVTRAIYYLARSCGGAAAIPPLSVQFEHRYGDGGRTCRFRSVTSLILTSGRSATFTASALGAGAGDSKLIVSMRQSLTAPNWSGLSVAFKFELVSDSHVNQQVTSAKLTLDGDEFDFGVFRTRQLLREVVFEGRYGQEGAFLSRLAAADTAVLRLYSAAGEVSRWSFDVSTLRNAPAALAGSEWRCDLRFAG